MQFIKDFEDGQRINGKYLVSNMTKGITNNGSPYLSITLQDQSGTIEARVWDASTLDEQLFAAGNIVEVTGDVNKYRQALQLKIQSGVKVEVEPEELANFVQASPHSIESLKTRLDEYLDSFQPGDLKDLINALFKKYYDDFLTFPAAVRNHHEFASGLAHHTLDMADLAEAIAKLYPKLDRDMLIAGVLAHDLGKVIELSGPVLPKYTPKGKLIGHISLCSAEILNTAEQLGTDPEVATLLAHMVLSHHGKLEYGSPVLPLTAEAMALSMIDDFDAKMMMIDKAYDDIEEGEFTNRLWALNNSTFYKPTRDE